MKFFKSIGLVLSDIYTCNKKIQIYQKLLNQSTSKVSTLLGTWMQCHVQSLWWMEAILKKVFLCIPATDHWMLIKFCVQMSII